MLTRYPYTVTNSYKGGFYMRTYGRNVRRAWDGDDYRAPKRQRLDNEKLGSIYAYTGGSNENNAYGYELEDNLERAIRETSVAALSSSPSRKNSMVFSLNESMEEPEPTATITPPSSPPPPELNVTPPNHKARKPTFSMFDKKKQKEKEKLKASKHKRYESFENTSTHAQNHEALAFGGIIENSHRTFSQPAPISLLGTDHQYHPKPAQTKVMTQTILDFGQSMMPLTCAQCQMSYTPSVAEDVQLHDMFHNRHSHGIELGKVFLRSAMKWCYEVPQIPGSVVVVDRKISPPARRVVQRVLEVVNKELGSFDIPEAELWSQKALDGEDGPVNENAKKVDRYKVFLHVINGKCAGVCLSERITKAYRVRKAAADPERTPRQHELSKKTNSETGEEDGSNSLPTPISASPNLSTLSSPAELELEVASVPAIVGVSRIWTSRVHRRKGIAVNLLECVMNQFIYGMEIAKEEIAFSTPTELGTALAKAWHGESGGWNVYRET